MIFPVIKMKLLYHVGDMASQPAPHSRESHEGPCLSVSEVPGAWRSIARLGDAPLWTLRKPTGAFLNMLRLPAEAKDAIVQWGYANGYAVEGIGWVSEFHPDDEDEGADARYCVQPSLEESVRQCGEVGEQDDDCEVRARYSKPMPFATDKLVAYAEQQVDLLMVFDMLALAYAEQVLDLDGLFWDENLNILRYSAPRGGLLRSKLGSWTIKKARKGASEPGEGEY
jgi:hypothetical protein